MHHQKAGRKDWWEVSRVHRCKKRILRFFIIFIKNAFLNVFLFLERFLFSSGKFVNSTKPPIYSYIKRLLSDGFNMATIGNSLMKSHSS